MHKANLRVLLLALVVHNLEECCTCICRARDERMGWDGMALGGWPFVSAHRVSSEAHGERVWSTQISGGTPDAMSEMASQRECACADSKLDVPARPNSAARNAAME